MTRLERHNQYLEEVFINKKAGREREILRLKKEIAIRQAKIEELEALNARGPQVVNRTTKGQQ